MFLRLENCIGWCMLGFYRAVFNLADFCLFSCFVIHRGRTIYVKDTQSMQFQSALRGTA